MLLPKAVLIPLVILCLLPPTVLAGTSFQKVCQGGGISSVTAARTMCQDVSPSHFIATPFSAADDVAIKALLGGVTAMLGASGGTYTDTYTWIHGPRNGETLMIRVAAAHIVNGYYHGFPSGVAFGANYVLGINSAGWTTLSSSSNVTCVICASRPAAEVCHAAGAQAIAAGNWLSAASCTCRAGYRGSDCSLQFQSYCDGPYGTLDAYNTQCAARGMYLATPDTKEEVFQVGRSIPQHLTVPIGGRHFLAF